MENIGKRLRQIRREKGMSQKDFGRQICVAQTYLSQIELGERAVTEKICSIVCMKFGICENWLRTGEGEMYRDEVVTPEDKPLTQLLTDVRTGKNPIAKAVLSSLALCSPEEWKMIGKIIREIHATMQDSEKK